MGKARQNSAMITKLDYNINQLNSIVVIGAGPSLNDYIDKINNYITANDAVVIGSNYNYPIASDFTLFTGPGTFKHSMANINSPNIIITSLVLSRRQK